VITIGYTSEFCLTAAWDKRSRQECWHHNP
jgi:hypothetical protein